MQELPVESFAKDRAKKDGLKSVCRRCDSARCVKWGRENAAHKRAYRRKWYAENPEKIRAVNARSHLNHRAVYLVRSARERAKAKGLPFDLDQHFAEVRERVDAGHCEMTGLPFDLRGGKTFNSPSIDRIDPAQGYLYSNIRIVLHAMNCALGTWGEGPLMEMLCAWQQKREQ